MWLDSHENIGAMGRREKKNELTRSIILDAAAELFAKKGYQATSVEDIVQSASGEGHFLLPLQVEGRHCL